MKWFKHFTNSHNNNKLTKVRMKYGSDGYAIYWYCMEIIAGELGTDQNITFELKQDAEVIGFNLKIDQIRVEEIMSFMIAINLFEESEGVITCLKLAKYLDPKLTKNETIKKIITQSKVITGDRSGYVYFIGAIDQGSLREVKIGRSINPWARLPEIDRSRRSDGFNAELLATFKTTDSVGLESALHQSFSIARIKNEWFQPVTELKSLISAVNADEFSTNDDVLRSNYVVNSSQLRPPLDTDTDTDIKDIYIDKPSLIDCPHEKIIDMYHEILPSLRQVKTWNKTRQGYLKQRWREEPLRQNLEWWSEYFVYVSGCDFLMGRIQPKEGVPFEADLEWLIKPSNFAKVREGKYENR